MMPVEGRRGQAPPAIASFLLRPNFRVSVNHVSSTGSFPAGPRVSFPLPSAPRPRGFWVSDLALDVLLFATLFIFGDKKVVHDVSRQEAGRNQAGATARGTSAMPQRDQAMELVVSENFVPTVRSPWFVLFFSCFSFTFLEFKSNNTPSSCYATDERTS